MIGVPARLSPSLRAILVCPLCKGTLNLADEDIRCRACHRCFPQTRSDCVDLLPTGVPTGDAERWSGRQASMTRWYRDLLDTPGDAAACFQNDYRPYSALLGTLTGRVLDVGGGNGVVRHYLHDGVEYVLLEPELSWLDARWTDLVDRFPCLATPAWFVRGLGEHMPFAEASFEAVLGFWSLNHAVDPPAVIAEAARVLRPGGLLLLVLEDIPPRWRDFGTVDLLRGGPLPTARLVRYKLRTTVLGRPWPLQPDHVRLTESQLRAWTHRLFKTTHRHWANTYLTLALQRQPYGPLDVAARMRTSSSES
jgi:SAM-dependent methyltransferase